MHVTYLGAEKGLAIPEETVVPTTTNLKGVIKLPREEFCGYGPCQPPRPRKDRCDGVEDCVSDLRKRLCSLQGQVVTVVSNHFIASFVTGTIARVTCGTVELTGASIPLIGAVGNAIIPLCNVNDVFVGTAGGGVAVDSVAAALSNLKASL